MKRKIVIFKGGGYDGCFWEWNAVVFEQGKSVEFICTGRKGKQFANQLASQNSTFISVRELIREPYQDVFIVRNEDEWKEACREFNSGFIRRVASVAELGCLCDSCKKMFPWDEIVHTGYQGDGGVGIQYTDNKCRECADQEHYEFVRADWPRLKLSERVKAIQMSRREGSDVSVFAARRDEMPSGVYAECVYIPEYY